jgi:mRNA interferase RelE/StbE
MPDIHKKALCKELLSLAKERFPRRWMHRIVGSRELYSVRSGDYRAIVKIEDDIMIILIIEIGHRSTIYRKFKS